MKTLLGIIGLHLWLLLWLYTAYQVFFGGLSEKNFEWHEKMWGRFMWWDKETYIQIEKVVMIMGVLLSIVVYAFALRDLLK